MIIKKSLLSLFFVFTALCIHAQVRFTANPFAISRNADALLSIVAMSSYPVTTSGEIIIAVTEDGSDKPIVTISFANVSLFQGSNSLTRFRANASRIFYDNELSRIAANTGLFPPANYMICCRFNPDDKALPGLNEQCFFSTVMPKTPITLIQPIDSICNFKPYFTWSGRKAASPDVAFKVVCTEVKEKQSAEEAMQNNFPLINRLIYRQANQMAFPSGIPAFTEGKKYAWQVFEVTGNNILNSSEIDEFTVGCSESAINGVESFAEVKPFYTGRKYYFSSTINFSFTNPYTGKKLEYAIIHVATQKKLTNLPEIKMATGLNKIILNTEDIKGLQKNEQYKIEIYNLATTIHYINFIINE